MTKQELLDLVNKIQSAEGTEEELDELSEILRANVLEPNAEDYLFQKEFEELSAEEIVEKILSFEPTILHNEQKNSGS